METNKQVLLLTSFPPQECGIASYSIDLAIAINEKFNRSFSVVICALTNKTTPKKYPTIVKYVLNTNGNINQYIELAREINSNDEIGCLLIQHEFGLFSGEMGEHLLTLIVNVKKPVVTTFHTVLPQPDMIRKLVVKTIIELSEAVITMTKSSAVLLQKYYECDNEKIEIIPHGTHLLPWQDKDLAKINCGYEDRLVLSVFGLLSKNKNIETTLNALPEIKKQFPKVLFLILGKTHPEVIRQEGEKYREYLETLVKELEIEENVRFINRYLPLNELLNYLSLTDIYVFTSKDINQAVSGTFSYALACGCPIVTTPIPHTKEILNGDMGVFFDFENHGQLAKEVIMLLQNPQLRYQMSLNAYHTMRASSWENVAIAHATLLSKFINRKERLLFTHPQISLNHLFAITEPKGVFQFSVLNHPDKAFGFTLDDNSRALIALTLNLRVEKVFHDEQVQVYLNFIENCQQDDGSFLNYINYEGEFTQQNFEVNLEDSNGRAIWALGEYLSECEPLDYSFAAKAKKIFKKALKFIDIVESPRALSFTIKGLYFYNQANKDPKIDNLIISLAKKLQDKYYDHFDPSWEWFENYLTYANSIMPEAMLYAYLTSGERVYKVIAKNSFDFLLKSIFDAHQIKVISNDGWKIKGKDTNRFGEQPIDVAYTIIALYQFYKVFGEEQYATFMDIAFSWFLGNNYLSQSVYDSATSGCCDGLEEHNVNLNQGAESTICYLMARLTIEEMKNEKRENNVSPIMQVATAVLK